MSGGSANSHVAFPPGPTGVLVPVGDRLTAAAGVTMYTAARPWVRRVQGLAWACSLLSPRLLPGKRSSLELDDRDLVLSACREAVGPVETVALYRRRDGVRSGATLLAVGRNQSKALVKVRPQSDGLVREQRLLAAVRNASPETFSVPEPLGYGTLDDSLTWSAQTFVFSRPHAPVTELPLLLSEDLTRTSGEAFEALGFARPTRDGYAPAHGDLTPWNLRRDHRGRVWLFDWEDATWAPPLADEVYFNLAAQALDPRFGAPSGRGEALDFWRHAIQARIDQGHRGELNHRMLALTRSWQR